MKLITFFIFLISCAFSISAQIGGKYTYQFLNLETSPKSASLGSKLVSDFSNNPTAGLYNPAATNSKMVNNYAANYVNYISDINYGSAATAFQIKRSEKMIHFGIVYLNYGQFNGFDLQGNSTGDFTANEVALSLGFANRINDSDFHYGFNIKGISSKLEIYSSFGVALDAGLMYANEEAGLTLGFSIRNLGTQITTYAGTQEQLPLSIEFGIAKKLAKAPIKWFVTFQNLQNYQLAFSNSNRNSEDLLGGTTVEDDPTFFNNLLRHVNLGIELFSEKAINIRLGYNFRRSEELKIVEQRSFAGFSLGFGIRVKKLNFNYTYLRYNSAAAASMFGLHLNFGR